MGLRPQAPTWWRDRREDTEYPTSDNIQATAALRFAQPATPVRGLKARYMKWKMLGIQKYEQ